MTDQNSLLYTPDHEWLLVEDDVVTVGITDHAADQLGDIVYVELPAIGSAAVAGEQIGEIESTKSVGELFAPVDGEIVAVNDAVSDAPDTVNQDAFGAGWLVKIRLGDAGLPGDLLDESAYRAGLTA
jgi:glycine cleavage system H protein